MKEIRTRRWSTYESYYIELGNYKVADIIITSHAKERWTDRVEDAKTGYHDIAQFIWEHLKKGKVEFYYRDKEDVYIVNDDLIFVASFDESDTEKDLLGNPLHKMIIITFLGRMSETMELRDLKTYYSWLRHNRRMNLVKSSRKKK